MLKLDDQIIKSSRGVGMLNVDSYDSYTKNQESVGSKHYQKAKTANDDKNIRDDDDRQRRNENQKKTRRKRFYAPFVLGEN